MTDDQTAAARTAAMLGTYAACVQCGGMGHRRVMGECHRPCDVCNGTGLVRLPDPLTVTLTPDACAKGERHAGKELPDNPGDWHNDRGLEITALWQYQSDVGPPELVCVVDKTERFVCSLPKGGWFHGPLPAAPAPLAEPITAEWLEAKGLRDESRLRTVKRFPIGDSSIAILGYACEGPKCWRWSVSCGPVRLLDDVDTARLTQLLVALGVWQS